MALAELIPALVELEATAGELEQPLTDELEALFREVAMAASGMLVASADWPLPDADEVYDSAKVEAELATALENAKLQLDSSVGRALPGAPAGDYDTDNVAAKVAARHRGEVATTLLDGWNEGLSVDDMARRLEAVGQSSAQLVSRTTLNGMSNSSSLAGALFAGVPTKQWLSAGDGHVRPSHAALSGTQEPLNKPFVNGCRFPGDPFGPGAEVWNCRCTLIYVEGSQRSDELVAEPGYGRLGPTTLVQRPPSRVMNAFYEGDARANQAASDIKRASQAQLHERLKADPEWRHFAINDLSRSSTEIQRVSNWELPANVFDVEFEKAQDIKNLIQSWAQSSSDSNLASLRMQQAAADEFGVELSGAFRAAVQEANGGLGIWEGVPEWVQTSCRAFVRNQYQMTQEIFAEAGVTEVTLYRGLSLPFMSEELGIDRFGTGIQHAEAEIAHNPLSSWSARPHTAGGFATATEVPDSMSYVLSAKVPVSRILSIPKTGFGCLSEYEFVILGGEDSVTLWTKYGFEQALKGEVV